MAQTPQAICRIATTSQVEVAHEVAAGRVVPRGSGRNTTASIISDAIASHGVPAIFTAMEHTERHPLRPPKGIRKFNPADSIYSQLVVSDCSNVLFCEHRIYSITNLELAGRSKSPGGSKIVNVYNFGSRNRQYPRYQCGFQIICRGFARISYLNANIRRSIGFKFRDSSAFNKDIGPQLLLASSLRVSQNALSGKPQSNCGDRKQASEASEPKCEVGNRVTRRPLPKGIFFATIVAFLIGCGFVLAVGLGVPRLSWWLEERRINRAAKYKSSKGHQE